MQILNCVFVLLSYTHDTHRDVNNQIIEFKICEIHEIVLEGAYSGRFIVSGHVAMINFITPEFEVHPFLRPSRRLIHTASTAL